MKLGTLIANYLRSETQPSSAEIDELERVLNSMQMNNLQVLNWPGAQGIVDYNDIEIPIIRKIRINRAGNIIMARDRTIRKTRDLKD